MTTTTNQQSDNFQTVTVQLEKLQKIEFVNQHHPRLHQVFIFESVITIHSLNPYLIFKDF